MKEIEFEKIARNLLETFIISGKIALDLRDKGLITKIKLDNTPVTNGDLKVNEKLCNIRKAFEQFNLISALHTFLSKNDDSYNNLLPPLSLLSENDKKKLFEDLGKLDFNIDNLKVD